MQGCLNGSRQSLRFQGAGRGGPETAADIGIDRGFGNGHLIAVFGKGAQVFTRRHLAVRIRVAVDAVVQVFGSSFGVWPFSYAYTPRLGYSVTSPERSRKPETIRWEGSVPRCPRRLARRTPAAARTPGRTCGTSARSRLSSAEVAAAFRSRPTLKAP